MWSFEDILKLSYICFKKIPKERSKKATFDYLISEKGQQKKIMNININIRRYRRSNLKKIDIEEATQRKLMRK